MPTRTLLRNPSEKLERPYSELTVGYGRYDPANPDKDYTAVNLRTHFGSLCVLVEGAVPLLNRWSPVEDAVEALRKYAPHKLKKEDREFLRRVVEELFLLNVNRRFQ